MIKTNFRLISNKTFTDALVSLSGQVLPIEASYQLNKIIQEVEKLVDKSKGDLKPIFDKYADKDDKGQFQFDAQDGVKIKEECKPEFLKEWNEFLDKEVIINRRPIFIGSLKRANLAPVQINVLEPILTESNLEVVK